MSPASRVGRVLGHHRDLSWVKVINRIQGSAFRASSSDAMADVAW
jgi:hypothetical protein